MDGSLTPWHLDGKSIDEWPKRDDLLGEASKIGVRKEFEIEEEMTPMLPPDYCLLWKVNPLNGVY